MQRNHKIECTGCGKVIDLENPQTARKVVWSRGEPYCKKECILKKK